MFMAPAVKVLTAKTYVDGFLSGLSAQLRIGQTVKKAVDSKVISAGKFMPTATVSKEKGRRHRAP
jgi:hypothetical protein